MGKKRPCLELNAFEVRYRNSEDACDRIAQCRLVYPEKLAYRRPCLRNIRLGSAGALGGVA